MKTAIESILGVLVHQVVCLEIGAFYARAELTDGRSLFIARHDAEEEAYYATPYEIVWK